MASDTRSRLLARSAEAGVQLPTALCERLVVYYDLLRHWNRKINLTALGNTDEALDRLLLEPVAAGSALPQSPRLMDLGSGGGSPAIPLALALSAPVLVMVESRARKAAFLREALRVLDLAGTVESSRFEDVAPRPEYRESMELVSIRAVRIDIPTLDAASTFLSATGRIALFENAEADAPMLPHRLLLGGHFPLLKHSRLTLLRRA